MLEGWSPFRLALPVGLLVFFWTWETWKPFFAWKTYRIQHAAHNIGMAVFNTVILALLFGAVTVLVADWATTKKSAC